MTLGANTGSGGTQERHLETSAPDRPGSLTMMGKLTRATFAILISMALVVAPMVQAAVATPCSPTMVGLLVDDGRLRPTQ
jgi:hypothetical protein